ncbi:type IV pilus modification PilV family protein [Desulfoluna butyratoxydans]|uniref:Prokaryotic n-terminal methylation site n=1 Tax=Desulfoluna butyratoxydans TaxID=231438 RepID=A0A4U8YMZ7_9BACT|nr:prepilin-type N-terminal cleavage/methylation domain-containing protein [Desulfoluna butyratoxydans]VFQ45121.1 prokaryotic n-terminal methylation site [Desulfoluna butyratoxydans]
MTKPVRCTSIGHDEAGMTLIEVMVASVILLVGLLGLALMQVHAMKANAQARSMTEAANYASDRVEQIMSAVWTEETVDSDLAANDPDTPEDMHTATADGYTVNWVVTDASDKMSKTVNLTVLWTEEGKTHRVSQVVVRTMH